ncbi:MAG: DNA polymerase, archaeal type II, large subunit, partial [Halorubrum sp. J07HR59]
PIRSAGGTAQALSVLAADYARSLLGIEEFHARETETERYAEEVALYDTETGLQYTPKAKEVKYIVSNLPIMVDGEATGGEEVSGFRDLERVDTNSARGGMCLVLAEGIALKAPKIQRYTRSLDEVDWPWLQDLIDGTIGGDSESETAATESAAGESGDTPGDATTDPGIADGSPRADASSKFLRDLIAGRPVFSHPSESGGFRLRYGRARNHGFATAGVHPATMHLVDDFLATGTQIKTERPGKAAGVVPVDSIEGPTVKLANGDVRRIDDPEEAKQVRNGVKEVLDLGEYLVNYGEFVENNHPLAPASYTTEWWIAEFETTDANVRALQDDPRVNLADPSIDNALRWAQEFDCPLHPSYTYLWHDITVETLLALADAIESGERADSELTIERTEATRVGAESLLLDHTQTSDSLEIPEWQPLVESLGFNRDLQREWAASDLSAEAKEFAGGENAIRAVNEVAPFTLRERAPTRIGNRMGRPEKSESRDLSPAVHTLFPINEAGGAQRNLADASRQMDDQGRRGMLNVEVSERECPDCGELTFHNRCPDCGAHTEPHYECDDCGTICEPDDSGRIECPRCEWEVSAATDQEVDVNAAYRDALEAVGERESGFEILKGVQGLVSTNKPPEPIEKGILRAKNDVTAFKDGTVRYDMTDLPVTAVRPAELGVSADQFLELGYQEDIDGDQLRHDDQLVELNVQDIVLSDGAAEHMLKTADFVDDLLEQYYSLPRFYNVNDRDDLVGELVFGMAPHTSAATVGRVVGFTSAAVGYAHPYFHAAKRRNCFHPETEIEYRDDAGWHRETIDGFVEDRLQDPETDDFGTLVEELDGDIEVPSIDEHGTGSTQPVTAVSKHPSQDHLIAVETCAGRSIRVTPDHTMLRVADGGVQQVAASELAVGDSIPAATSRGKASATGVAGATTDGGIEAEQVASIDICGSDVDHTYNLTVAETHTLAANGLLVGQCDGDEDCVMLLMDGLLNFSKEYLPDQRGGSVSEDSRLVARDPQGRMRYLSFDEFWDELESPIDIDGKFKNRTCAREGWQTYTFDENHESSLQPIEKAIRYRADDDETLLSVETQFGRSIEITPNHSLFRYNDGIEEVAGEQLGVGDLIIAPQQLDVETQTETVIDAAECVDDPHVFIDESVTSCLQEGQDQPVSESDAGAVVNGGLSGHLSQTKMRLQTLHELKGISRNPLADVNPQIGRKNSSDGIQRFLTVSGDFSWLLGLLAAESSMSPTRPTITTADETIAQRAERSITEILDVEPSVQWANGTCEIGFPAVFQDILAELGLRNDPSRDSSETAVPDPIRRGDQSTVRSFLRGLLAGDTDRDGNGNGNERKRERNERRHLHEQRVPHDQ